MHDPTEIVLATCLILAPCIFAVSSLVRFRRDRKLRHAEPENAFPVADEGSPYQPPPIQPPPPAMPAGRVPVWFYRRLDLLGAGLVFLIFSSLVLASVGVPHDAVKALNPGTLLFNIGFQFFLAGAVFMAVAWRVGPVVWLGLRWRSWPWVFLIGPGTVIAMWFVFGGLEASGYMKWMESLGVETTQETVQLLQKSSDPVVLGLMAFAAVVAAPLCEELVFRGYFYPAMKKFAGMWPAAICSALVFASAHGSLAALPPLFLLGCVLVFVYEKTGSLWAPISVHFCFNASTVLIQLAVRYFHLPVQPPS